jgi:hypothetical protein
MGFRFFRRVRILPGVTLNFSRSGVSTSLGVRGAHVTFNRQGVRQTVGLPGSGLFYTTFRRYGAAPSQPPQNYTRLPPGYLKAKSMNLFNPQQTVQPSTTGPQIYGLLMAALYFGFAVSVGIAIGAWLVG